MKLGTQRQTRYRSGIDNLNSYDRKKNVGRLK